MTVAILVYKPDIRINNEYFTKILVFLSMNQVNKFHLRNAQRTIYCIYVLIDLQYVAVAHIQSKKVADSHISLAECYMCMTAIVTARISCSLENNFYFHKIANHAFTTDVLFGLATD
jgi:hypothetical protein